MLFLSPPLRKCLLSTFVFAACYLPGSNCPLPARVVRADETVSRAAPRVSPTPTPSPSPVVPQLQPRKPNAFRRVLNFLKCNRDKYLKEQELFRTGPQLPGTHDANGFSIVALVKGAWPVVVSYKLELQSSVIITVEVKDVEPLVEKLAGTGRSEERMLTLPARFGNEPQAALISIKASPDDAKDKRSADFRLYALGMGDDAVGSVSIDLTVHPDKINTARKEMLNYDFESRKKFDDVRAEFWRPKISQGKRKTTRVASVELGAIRQAEKKSSQWDGRKSVGRDRGFSLGRHELDLNARVRGAWLIVWSGDSPITVE